MDNERDKQRPLDTERSRQVERAQELELGSRKVGTQAKSEALQGREPLEGVFASVKSNFKDVYELGREGHSQGRDIGLAEDPKTPARAEMERNVAEAREKMVAQKADVVRSMDGWKPEVWERATEAQRWKTIEATEKAFAKLEGRDALPIGPMEAKIRAVMDATGQVADGFTKEGQPERAQEIQIARELVDPNHPDSRRPDRAMRAYFHEEHHVEQLQALEKPQSRPDFLDRDVALWTASMRAEKDIQKNRNAIGAEAPEYRQFAHEVSARYNETHLFLRVLDDDKR